MEEIPDFNIKDERFLETTKLTEEALTSEAIKKIEMIANPRIVTILRDKNGDVIATSLSVKYFAENIGKNEFNMKKIGTIYEIVVNSKYVYRATTCELTASSGEKYYIDILINVNSEREMMENFSNALSIATGIVVKYHYTATKNTTEQEKTISY